MGRKQSAPDTAGAARAAAEASQRAAEAAERAAREREDRARQEFQESLGRVKNFTGMDAPTYVKEAKQYFTDVAGGQVQKYESQLKAYDPNVTKQVRRLERNIKTAERQTNLQNKQFMRYATNVQKYLRKSEAGGQNLGFGTSELR